MKSSKAYHNTIWILIGSSFNKISTIVLLYVLSRYLGVSGYGEFSFVFFFVAFFSCIAEMGLTPILIKHINQDDCDASGIQGHGLILGLIGTFIAMTLAWSISMALGHETKITQLIIIASISLLISFRDITFRWILEVPFRASLRMAYPVITGICSELLSLILILIAVYRQLSLEWIVSAYVLAHTPGFFVLILLSFSSIKPSFRFEKSTFRLLFREASPIALSNSLNIVYLAFGSLILFQFRGAEEVGYYALAFRITTSLRIIPEAIMHSLFPSLAKSHLDKNTKELQDIFSKAVRYASMLSFPLLGGTLAVATSLTALLGGETFLPASLAVSILICATFLAFYNTVFRFTLNAISMQKRNLYISIMQLILTVVLSFVLIPEYGFIGACYTLVITEAIGVIFGLIISRYSGLVVSLTVIFKYFMASLAMVAIIWNMSNLFLQIVAGIFIYIIINCVTGGIKKEELSRFITLR